MHLRGVITQECLFTVTCRRCGYDGNVKEFVRWRVVEDEHGLVVEVYVKCPRCGAEYTIDADYVNEV